MHEKTKTILLVGGAVVLAAVFVMFGAGKFMDPAKWIGKFAAWGIPAWFVPVSGALELAGAVGLLIEDAERLQFAADAVADHVRTDRARSRKHCRHVAHVVRVDADQLVVETVRCDQRVARADREGRILVEEEIRPVVVIDHDGDVRLHLAQRIQTVGLGVVPADGAEPGGQAGDGGIGHR